MLQIFNQLFTRLNDNFNYIVYKGLAHLDKDLAGERGDIDLVIDSQSLEPIAELLKENGFKRDISNHSPSYFFGIDKETHKFTMLDIDHVIRLGHKPSKPYYLDIDISKFKHVTINKVSRLDYIDYIPLMFLYRVTANNPKQDELAELQLAISNYKINNGYICSILKERYQIEWETLSKEIQASENWNTLQENYKKKILHNSKIDYWQWLKQKTSKLVVLLKKINRKILKTPPYRVRREGLLVAFLGVDGAGKSSTIDYILGLNYFKFTGIKRIYFGSNEYWIPGLLWGLLNFQNKYIRGLLSILVYIDKSFRSLIAYYYIKKGYIVVADRFYYDDIIGLKINKRDEDSNVNYFRRAYRMLVKPRVWIKPDITIFLDVSPDVAHSRKQDYSFERMLVVNSAYKKYMPNVPNVVIINADQNKEDIYSEILENILRIDIK